MFSQGIMFLWLIIHIGSICMVGYGVYVSHSRLFHHKECDMTYSWRKFLPVILPNTTDPTTPYRLFQFFDQRDPRFSHLFRGSNREHLIGSDGCLENTTSATVVLYVPGHGGNYEQSRSLGAHGLQMPDRGEGRQGRHALSSGRWTGDASSIQEFVYEVYALDFLEEGTGLHGLLVQEQADFIADAIRHLGFTSCHYTSIILVAHSMGGYAARLALVQHTDIRPLVHTLVTLGTPHAHPVMAFDPSLYNIHKTITSSDLKIATVSISGGLRDEMVPPEACQEAPSSSQRKNFIHLLAPFIMENGTVEASMPISLGMDHRAIVWCRNLLDKVRTIIYLVAQAERQEHGEPQAKLDQLNCYFGHETVHSINYKDAVEQAHQTIKKELGTFASIAVESGFLYNADILVQAYVILGALHYMFGSTGSMTSSGGTLLLAFGMLLTKHAANGRDCLSLESILLITITANALFFFFLMAVQLSQKGFPERWNQKMMRCCWNMVGWGLLGLIVVSRAVLFVWNGVARFRAVITGFWYAHYLLLIVMRKPRETTAGRHPAESQLRGNEQQQQRQSTVVGMTTITTFAARSFSRTFRDVMHSPVVSNREQVFDAWSFPLIPVLMAGNIYASFIRPNKEVSGGWLSFLPFLRYSVVVVRQRLLQTRNSLRTSDATSFRTTCSFQIIQTAILFSWLVKWQDNLSVPLLWFAALDVVEVLLVGASFARDHHHDD